MRFLIPALAVAAAAGCAPTNDRSADSATRKPVAALDTGMPMQSMPARAVGSGAMVEQMRVHLQAMRAMNADSMRMGLPMHREMTDGMMAQMTREMMQMKMPADPRWSALMDSVHQDLARMPGMNGSDLEKTMAEHRARLTRLMEMHHRMLEQKPVPRR